MQLPIRPVVSAAAVRSGLSEDVEAETRSYREELIRVTALEAQRRIANFVPSAQLKED